MRWPRICLLIVLFGLSAAAASFDCSKAISAQEKAIRADLQLSKLDEDTAAAYQTVRHQLSTMGAAEVQQDQREWAASLRQTCPDLKDQGRRMSNCLKNGYSDQLQMLKDGAQHVGGATFFPRLKVVIAPDRQKPVPGSVDLGFGVGRFSWPEIDQPTRGRQRGMQQYGQRW